MEMERINDNTIRVLIYNSELEDRGITALDLVGSHNNIESFFYNILQEVDEDHTFEDTEAITFQVLPNKEGIELLISKTNDTMAVSDLLNNLGKDDKSKYQISDFVKQKIQEKSNNIQNQNNFDQFVTKDKEVLNYINYEMDSFEDIVDFMSDYTLTLLDATIYKLNNKYYLTLFDADTDDNHGLDDSLVMINDYGRKADVSYEYLKEFGKPIMASNAIQTIKDKFN